MTNPTGRVLVFGDDMRIFLSVARSLGRAGKEVHAAPFNWHAPALRSRYVAAVHRLPRYADDPDAWRAAVSDLLRRHRFDLVVPLCDDRAILPFHMHRADFAPWRIALPDPANMDLLFDKERTRALAAELGVPVAPGDRLGGADTAAALAARYGLPLVLKPRRSFWADRLDGWGKVHIVESEPQLAGLLRSIDEPERYLVEGWFAGVGVGVSVLAEGGEILQAFQHRRLREGWGGSSSYRISEPVDPALRDACDRICRRVGLTGVCMFEFRRQPATGKWILLETNARFWGSSSLPLALGVDFPRFLHDLLVHGRRPAAVSYAGGIRSRNAVLDGMNLLASLRRIGWRDLPAWLVEMGRFLLQPLSWLTGRERSDAFVSDDPRPGFAECALLARSVRDKIVRSRARGGGPQRRGSEQPAG
jgi:predicted ATP-grasp superfamily ATP-dependent carboligase